LNNKNLAFRQSEIDFGVEQTDDMVKINTEKETLGRKKSERLIGN
jgi:hypothetical protein